MTNFPLTQCVLFANLGKRPVELTFDQAHGRSDGGAILLSAVNRYLQLSAKLMWQHLYFSARDLTQIVTRHRADHGTLTLWTVLST